MLLNSSEAGVSENIMTTPKGNLWLAYTLATNTFQFAVSDIFKEPLREGRTKLKKIILKAELNWIYKKEKKKNLLVCDSRYPE